MDVNAQWPKHRDDVLSTLNVIIEVLDLAKEMSGITPAKAAFGSVSAVLVVIRVLSLLFYLDKFRAHMYVGLNDQPGGLC